MKTTSFRPGDARTRLVRRLVSILVNHADGSVLDFGFAEAVSISLRAVQRIWQANHLQPQGRLISRYCPKLDESSCIGVAGSRVDGLEIRVKHP